MASATRRPARHTALKKRDARATVSEFRTQLRGLEGDHALVRVTLAGPPVKPAG
jgi:hypothetical protein